MFLPCRTAGMMLLSSVPTWSEKFGGHIGEDRGGQGGVARAGGLGVSLRVTVTACARGHALPTCPPARQRHQHRHIHQTQ